MDAISGYSLPAHGVGKDKCHFFMSSNIASFSTLERLYMQIEI